MRSTAGLCCVAVLLAGAAAAHADPLRGTSVTGNLSVNGDGGNDFLNDMAIVGPGPEFDGLSFSQNAGLCTYTVNVKNAGIAVRDVCTSDVPSVIPDANAAAATKPLHDPFVITITDLALLDDTISPLKNGLGLNFDLTGDVLTFTFDGGDPNKNRSTFALASAVTPEPASWQLLVLGGLGLLGFGSLHRCRALGLPGSIG